LRRKHFFLFAACQNALPNRVSAGISPALPTPPGMRVRTRRLKQGNENVPYKNNPHGHGGQTGHEPDEAPVIRKLKSGMSPGISFRLVMIFTALVVFNAGCSENAPDLADAAKEGRIEEIKSYLDEGGNPNVVNDMKQTALLLAAIEEHPDIVRLLLAKGADPNIADVLGQTPLFFASYNQDLDSVEALIKAGADVNAMTGSGEFALLRAVTWGNTRLVEMLVNGGADVNMKPADTRVPPPLQLAIQGQMKEIEKILRQAGATE